MGIDKKPNTVYTKENGVEFLNRSQAFGTFYNDLLAYYSGTSAEKSQEPPTTSDEFWIDKATQLESGLAANSRLISQHQGGEAKFLLESGLRGIGKNDEEIGEIVSGASFGEITFTESHPGVAMLEMEPDAFRYFQSVGLINPQGDATAFCSKDENYPSFMIVTRHGKSRSLVEGGVEILNKGLMGHELHHLVWNFATRNIQDLDNESLEEKAFRSYQDEFCAHIVNHRKVNSVPVQNLIYTDDKNLAEVASRSAQYAVLCMDLGKVDGLDGSAFFLPAMAASNFEELDQNIQNLISLPPNLTPAHFEVCFDEWANCDWKKFFGEKVDYVVPDFLKTKGVVLTPESVNEWARYKLLNVVALSEHQLELEMNHIRDFLSSIAAADHLEENILPEVAAKRFDGNNQ